MFVSQKLGILVLKTLDFHRFPDYKMGMISNFKVSLYTKMKETNMCDVVLLIIGEGNKTDDESGRNSELSNLVF